MNLYTFANYLKKLGLVNAINLDGGGSATFVINGTTVNYPSDKWYSYMYIIYILYD
jgi:exopolysaccharide biosynthesis protein